MQQTMRMCSQRSFATKCFELVMLICIVARAALNWQQTWRLAAAVETGPLIR